MAVSQSGAKVKAASQQPKQKKKFRFINWLTIFLLNVATSGRCKVNQPKPIRFTGCGRWIVLIV